MSSIISIDLCNFTDFYTHEKDSDRIWAKLESCQWNDLFHKKFTEILCNRIPDEDCDTLLCSGLAYLFAFIQENFVGPCSETKVIDLVDSSGENLEIREKLSIDGYEVNTNVKYPELLLASKNCLDHVSRSDPDSLVYKWWKMRHLYIHQLILDEKTITLYENFQLLSEELVKELSQIEKEELQILLLVEICHGYLLFKRPQNSNELFDKACKLLNIDLNIEGVMGVRTKYQQKALPQLFLKITEAAENCLPSSNDSHGSTKLPKLLRLDDDVRLERITFVDAKDNEILNIPSAIQAIVLAKCQIVRKSQPKDKLSSEELAPYITTLVYQSFGPLSIRLKALLLNVMEESDHKRTVERSLKQCEEILKLVTNDQFSLREKLSYIFASSLPPRWQVQTKLADIMLSLGFVKSSLDIYLKIDSCEDVIHCYTRLGLRQNAAEVIRQEIDKKSTVKMYCLLGDATDDVSCYETAWKLSKETSGRAQRHWGDFYFDKKDYKNAIPHLEKSLEINSLQEATWLRLGFAAFTEEKWSLAVRAYIRYEQLEPNCDEKCSKLARALINLFDLSRAHAMLTEAIKCNFNDWKIWENYMLVSVDTDDFEDALNAYVRLTELKEKYIDLEVIEILVNCIYDERPDAKNRPSGRLRKKAINVLGQQCSSHPNEPKLRELAAKLSETSLSRAQKLQKTYHTLTQSNTSWANQNGSCIRVLEISLDLCKATLAALNEQTDVAKYLLNSQISSARLCGQACCRVIENSSEQFPECQPILVQLKEIVEELTSELKSRV